MLVDAHCHLTPDFGPSALIRAMDEANVERAVLVAHTLDSVSPGGLPPALIGRLLTPYLNPIGRYQYSRKVRNGHLLTADRRLDILPTPDNDAVREAVRACPDRFIGFALVNPADPGHLKVVERHFSTGFRGVKVHAWHHRANLLRSIDPLARACGEAGYPLLIHLGGNFKGGASVLRLADRFPATNFILAEAGVPYYQAVWRATREHANLYFDLSGPDMPGELLRLLTLHVPPGRLLFASGGPGGLGGRGGGYSYEGVKRRLEALGLGGEAERAVKGGTLMRLIGLARPTARLAYASETHGGLCSSSRGR